MLASIFLIHAFALLPAHQEPSPHPADAEAFAGALGIRRAFLTQAPGLELWTDTASSQRLLEKPLLKAWEHAEHLLGPIVLPEGVVIRVVALDDRDTLANYRPIFTAEGIHLQSSALPDADWFRAAIETGSGCWDYPPLLIIHTGSVGKAEVLTRLVHDIGGLRGGYAMSRSGYGIPESWREGFGGLLVRHALKKPTAIVSHTSAALSSTVRGYGVFAGIEHAANDASNHPNAWPGFLYNAIQRLQKTDPIHPAARVDQLLLRTAAEFSRADYAYSWAAVSFLLDGHYPAGKATAEALKEGKRWKAARELAADSRRTRTLSVLARLRAAEHVALDAEARASLFREQILLALAEDEAAFHAAFAHWVMTAMPRK